MTPQTEAEDLRFVERSPDWLRFGGAVFLLIIAVSIAAGAAIDSIWGAYPLVVGLLFAAVWQWRLAKITVRIDDQSVILTGPVWRRVVSRQNVHDISVADDNGMNPGLVNWPVTSHEHGTLTRLNMGGSAAVTFSDSSGHRYQFVLARRQDAELIAEAISP
ncbi:hypothetical protein [Arthrobacter rhombi]|uniref:hypothetical protein n=1 Tax=Arthrobacter rhombi TaxID=71253 RepID=UPI003F91BFDB